jgi:hypothetical protein
MRSIGAAEREWVGLIPGTTGDIQIWRIWPTGPARQPMDHARNRQGTCARRGWMRSVPLLRWLRQEFRADRGCAVLFAHVLEDLQGILEPGPCLGFAAEFA